MWRSGRQSCEKKDLIELEMDRSYGPESTAKLESLFLEPQKHLSNRTEIVGHSLIKVFGLIRVGLKWLLCTSLKGDDKQPPQYEQQQRNKHVMFADSLGLDLELIHTIRLQQSGNAPPSKDELITRQSFLRSYGSVSTKANAVSMHHGSSETLIIPKFALSPDRNYEKLIKNRICLNSVEFYDQSSIRGVILTLTKSTDLDYASTELNYSSSFTNIFES